MEYEKRIIRLQVAVRLGQWYKRWRIKNVKAPPTYFPTGPFKLIKEYVGFDPTYRHKKIAGFIKSELGENSMWQHRHGDAAWTRPPQWEWHEQNIELEKFKDNKEAFIDRLILVSGGPRADALVSYNYHLRNREDKLKRLAWMAVVATPCYSPRWHVKLMRMLSPKKCKICKITIADLKQFCRENKMVGYSSLNKTQLCHFILKYDF